MHGTAILRRHVDADHRGQEASEVSGAPDRIEDAGVLEVALQRHRVGKLAGVNATPDQLEQPLMDRIGECLGRQEMRYEAIGLVVREARSQQRLLGGHVRGRQSLRQPFERALRDVGHGSDQLERR